MSKELIDLYNTLYLRGFIRDIDGVNSTILKNAIKEIDRLQKELEQEKEKNKELNLENQALYESINCNDNNMLARRYEKLQKEVMFYRDERETIKNNLEIDLERIGVYAQAKGQIAQILEIYRKNDNYLLDLLKEN